LINYCLLAKGLIGEMPKDCPSAPKTSAYDKVLKQQLAPQDLVLTGPYKGMTYAEMEAAIKRSEKQAEALKNPFAGVEAARRTTPYRLDPAGEMKSTDPQAASNQLQGLGPEHC
jgi:hypothetical protein